MMAGITSPTRRHLTPETITRIELSLSSTRSSVVVFNTTARLYTLDKEEWSSMAYGAPCIIILRDSTEPASPFNVKLAIAELESGINLWEELIRDGTGYTEQEASFHTFSGSDKQTLAMQFADEREAKTLLTTLKQLYSQKCQLDMVYVNKNKPSSKSNERKPAKKSLRRRLTKFDISLPCNFQHVSGLTNHHTDVCEQELRGTIQRKLRSQSMSALEKTKVRSRKKIPEEFTDSSVYNNQRSSQADLQQVTNSDLGKGRSKSKYHSLRLTKKKPLQQLAMSVDDLSMRSRAPGSDAFQENRFSISSDRRYGNMPQGWAESWSISPHSPTAVSNNDLPSSSGPQFPQNLYINTSHKEQSSSPVQVPVSSQPPVSSSLTRPLPAEQTVVTRPTVAALPPEVPLASYPTRLLSQPAGSSRFAHSKRSSYHEGSYRPISQHYKATSPTSADPRMQNRAQTMSSSSHQHMQRQASQPSLHTIAHQPPQSISNGGPRSADVYRNERFFANESLPSSSSRQATQPVPVQAPRPPSTVGGKDAELDDLTSELSKLLHDFDNLILTSSPPQDHPNSLV